MTRPCRRVWILCILVVALAATFLVFIAAESPAIMPANRQQVLFLMRSDKARSYGQFGSQMQCFMDLLLAVRGGPHQLVEPVFFIQPRNNTAYELAGPGARGDHFLGTAAIPWSSWLDMGQLERFLHQTPLPWQDAPPHIDLLLSTLNECSDGVTTTTTYQQRVFRIIRCQRVPTGLGMEAWRRLLTLHANFTVAIDAYGGDMWPQSIRWRDAHPKLWREALSAVRFSADIERVAAAYAPTHTCLHWRRGDRAHAEMSDYGLRYWERAAPQRIAQHMARGTFIMTNSGNQGERNLLSAAGGRFLEADVFPHWHDELKRLGVEMSICMASAGFVALGSEYWDCSTPSRLIIDWRAERNVTYLWK